MSIRWKTAGSRCCAPTNGWPVTRAFVISDRALVISRKKRLITLTTTSISYPVATKPSTLPIADTIGFLWKPHSTTRFHRPIITALQAQGQSCTLVINDRVFKTISG